MLEAIFLCALAAGQTKPPAVSFEDLKPVFKKHCLNCHNGERPRGGLDMTSKASILSGSDSGVSLTAGKPRESLLFRMVAHIDAPHMPPNSARIPESELIMIERWISAGLPERKDLPKAATVAMSAAGQEKAMEKLESKPMAPARRLPAAVSVALLPDGSVARPLAGALGIGDGAGSPQGGGVAVPFGEPEVRVVRASGPWLLMAGGESGKSGKASLLRVSPPSHVRDFGEDFDTIMAADIHAKTDRVATAGTSRAVKVYKLSNGTLSHTIKDHIDWIMDARFSPEGLLLATGDRSGTTLLTESETGAKVHALRSGGAAVHSIAWRTDSNALATAAADGKIRVWDAHHGGEIASWMAHDGGAMAVAALAGNRWLSIGRDRRAVVWSALGEVSAVIETFTNSPLSIASGEDGAIVFGLASGEIIKADTGAVSLPAIPAAEPMAKTAGMNSDARAGILKTLEETAERMKNDAAAHPERKELAESYLSLCRSIVLLKAEILKDQAAGGSPK